MEGSPSRLETALANICLLADHGVRQQTPKIDSCRNTEELVWMLASMVFDLQRRMEHLYLATEEFGPRGTPSMAARLRRESQDINNPQLSWEERARLAERMMLALYEYIGPAHAKLLDELAGPNAG